MIIDPADLAEPPPCERDFDDPLLDAAELDQESDAFLSDAQADADALASAGMGTDEDYFPETPIGEEMGGE